MDQAVQNILKQKTIEMKTAIVIGATGLIGNQLVQKLIADERYRAVKVFVRRSLGISNPKLTERIVDFDNIEKWKDEITGDELFSAMGTTIKKAGSKEIQYKIDFTYQYEFAEAASKNGVEKYFLVSSAGASTRAGNFYLKIKGELEERVIHLSFKKIFIFRPSILLGERKEKRRSEEIGASVAMVITSFIPFLRKYRPIKGETVAEAMINSANDVTHSRVMIYILDQIFQIAV